ncbi:family 16 glycosylhydrolase [Formosa sp. PL04]|uniref:family 16 glycosylhydrolase n=1 Tax=Formosa sp. PL04 TaxID=3081755 RepID=UPI002981C766|nr:family 16 glycosylhydrolase [Formosa sp. PL04]MDW5287555.1 family 16 glycosylhydrolase [Formosa sp. PL04]
MKKSIFYNLSFILFGVSVLISCGSKEKSKEVVKEAVESKVVEIKVEAEDFTASSEDFETIQLNDVTYISPNSEGWVEVAVNVPISGRYTTAIQLSSEVENASFWVEDYADNTVGRTYNITGNMLVEDAGFSVINRDGSPLKKGIHKMKIHFNAAVNIDWLKFTLLRESEVTPQNLTQKTDGKDWKVVWADEFEGTEVDTSKWTYDIGNWGWGNFEAQYYTVDRKENARVEDGNLIIEARKNDMGQEWTSARLTTRGKTSFTYGRIELRAKVPVNRGNWAAGWTLGDTYIDESSWPECGEIDILESVGYEMDDATGNGIAHASVHCNAYYFKIGNQKTFIVDVEKMNTEFHTYAIEWTPEKITGFVDDTEYFYYNNNGEEDAWPFDNAQNIILNLAMGGGWGGAQGMDETMTSQKMIIDYVRVLELQ